MAYIALDVTSSAVPLRYRLAYLAAELASHPLAVAGFTVLEQRGLAKEARDRLLNILIEANEEADGFRSTSQYVVVMGRPY